MSEEEFRGLVSHLRFEDGTIFMGNSRSVILPTSWLSDLMMELENLMGVPGTYALLDNASRRNLPDPATLVRLKDLPFEHKIAAFLKNASLVGFGNMEVKEVSKDPLKIVLKNPAPIFDDAYQGKADGPRCYFNNSFLPRLEAIIKMEGIDSPLKYTETQCKAMGAPHCEFVIEPDTGDSW